MVYFSYYAQLVKHKVDEARLMSKISYVKMWFFLIRHKEFENFFFLASSSCTAFNKDKSIIKTKQCQHLQTTHTLNRAKSKVDMQWIMHVFIRSGLSKGCGCNHQHNSIVHTLMSYCIFMCLNLIESNKLRPFFWVWSKVNLANSGYLTEIVVDRFSERGYTQKVKYI